MANKVRVGLLIDEFVLPIWVVGMIKKITTLSDVEIVVIITDANTSKHPQNNNRAVYNFYTKLDKRIYSALPDASQPADLNPWIKDIPQLQVTSVLSEKGKIISEAGIKTIKTYNTTVLIKLGFQNLSGAILEVPQLGVWSLNCYKETATISSPAATCFFNGEDITAIAVHILHHDAANQKTIYRSFSMTDKKSLNRNINAVYWKSLSFIPRLLAILAANGQGWFWKYTAQHQQENITSVANKQPSSTTIWVTLIKKITAEIGNRLRDFFYADNWKLFYYSGYNIETGVAAFKKIPSPKGAFWADPHVVHFNDRPFVFFEEWDYTKQKGFIAAFEFTNDGNIPQLQKILEKPYHLSYPFTFEWQGVYYMIPETAGNRTIELYRCTNFPDQWEFVMNLMENVHAVDTTLFFYNNKWWMFTNMVENKGASSLDELFIFHAADFITTNWQPHKLNPVISDARSARPAGALFMANEKLYRPSQCSDKMYGHSTYVNEIIILNENEFAEISTAKLSPGETDKNCFGIHSYSRHGKLTVIDKFYRERK